MKYLQIQKKGGGTMKKTVCIKCGANWQGIGSPAICPVCKQESAAIVTKK